MEFREMLRRSQTRIDLLFTMSKIPQARPLGARMRSDVFADVCFWRSGLSDRWSARLRSLSYAGHASPFCHPVAAPRVARRAKRGGARRDRTDDLMLAKHALSQLSYGPVTRRRMLSRRLLSCISLKRTRSKWWAWEDLNFRPHAYQARALTN